MPAINQQPAELDLIGVAGSPFVLSADITATDSQGDPISWGNFSDWSVVISNANLQPGPPAALPTVTSPGSGELQITWSAEQTALLLNTSYTWALLISISDEGPYALLAGNLRMGEPTQAGSSTGTTVDLTVLVGTATASVAIALGGSGGGGGGAVDSVNGQTGVVVLDHTDVEADAAGAAAAAQAAAEAASDPSGSATTAQTNAETFATNAVATETSRAESAEALALKKSSNLSDLASAPTARTNLGLGSAATHASTDFDAAGAAASAQSAAEAASDPVGSAAAAQSAAEAASDPVGSAATAQSNAEAFATSAVGTETTRAEAAEALLAPLASPALTGGPTAPTATPLTNSTVVATTAYADVAVAVETARAEAAETALPSAGNLPFLHKAIANVLSGTSDAKLGMMGDSITGGGNTGSGSVGVGPTKALATILSAAGIPAAVGLTIPQFGTDAWVALGSGWSLNTTDFANQLWGGLGISWKATTSAAGSLVFTPTSGSTYDSYDIYFQGASGGFVGHCTASLPGATNVSVTNAGTGVFKVTIGPGTATVNAALTLGTVGGGVTAGCYIYGVEPFLSTTKRVRVGDMGVFGATTVGWTGASGAFSNGPLACLEAYAANVWTLELGGNDTLVPVPLTTVTANYSTIASAMRNASSDIVGTSVPPLASGSFNPTLVASYMANLKTWCAANGAGYLDVLTAWGGSNNFTALNSDGYYADSVGHPSVLGYADIGRLLATGLLRL